MGFSHVPANPGNWLGKQSAASITPWNVSSRETRSDPPHPTPTQTGPSRTNQRPGLERCSRGSVELNQIQFPGG